MKDTFENAKSSESNEGKKKLTFDQERLAAAANYNNVGEQASTMINAEERYKNQPTDKNPYGPGVKGNRKDQLTDLQKQVNDQKQQVRAGSKEPTGPNIGAKIDQLVSGEVTVETEGTRKAKEDRQNLKDGATGNALLASAADAKQNQTPYGKGMISEGKVSDAFSGGLQILKGVKEMDPVDVYDGFVKLDDATGGVAGQVASKVIAPYFPVPEMLNNYYQQADAQREALEKLTPESRKAAELQKKREAEDAKKAEEEAAKKAAAEAAAKKEAEEKKKKEAEKGSGSTVKDPGEYQGLSPEQLGLAGYKSMSPGAVFHRKGSGDGGDIDPDSNATPKGPVFNDAQIHLQEMGKYGMVGQPDQTFHTGGGTGSAGTGQQGGDIDMGPDSPSQDYTGATRTEDPADVNFNVEVNLFSELVLKKKKRKQKRKKKSPQ